MDKQAAHMLVWEEQFRGPEFYKAQPASGMEEEEEQEQQQQQQQ